MTAQMTTNTKRQYRRQHKVPGYVIWIVVWDCSIGLSSGIVI
jgi:hypothetical protein